MKTARLGAAVVAAMLCACCTTAGNEAIAQTMTQKMYITIAEETQSVTLVDNTASQELVSRLQRGDVDLTLEPNGDFEIWGPLGFALPTSNQQITAQPGDVILYGGSNICIFCGTNTWSYTRIGHIDGMTDHALRSFLQFGQSEIQVRLSLSPGSMGIEQIRRDKDEEAYYTLAGRQASNHVHGIYIKCGKKIATK